MRIPFRSSLVLLLCVAATLCSAQERVDVRACTKSGKEFTCDRHSFKSLLHVARSVSVNSPRLDTASSKELTRLAASLDKTVRPTGGDLTFVLVRTDPSGIYVGPGDSELASLRVLYGAADGRPGKIVWVESYYGQPDTPWPIVVHHLTEQFRKEFTR